MFLISEKRILTLVKKRISMGLISEIWILTLCQTNKKNRSIIIIIINNNIIIIIIIITPFCCARAGGFESGKCALWQCHVKRVEVERNSGFHTRRRKMPPQGIENAATRRRKWRHKAPKNAAARHQKCRHKAAKMPPQGAENVATRHRKCRHKAPKMPPQGSEMSPQGEVQNRETKIRIPVSGFWLFVKRAGTRKTQCFIDL